MKNVYSRIYKDLFFLKNYLLHLKIKKFFLIFDKEKKKFKSKFLFNKFKIICLISKNTKSVSTIYSLDRHFLKYYFSKGYLNGLRKASG